MDNYRIIDANNRIMYTGGNSWMTLDEAKKRVNRQAGEMIYEYTPDYQHRMWEVL